MKRIDLLNTLVTYVNGRFGFEKSKYFLMMRDFNNNDSENFRNQNRQ
ncbi:MAG: hypothetical protein IPH28_16845 [Cytophagaceae bacterium]|nr:hypothetical protein [Cytophagaceae bacterium]